MKRTGTLEPAVNVGDDPRQYAQVLTAVYDAAMSGGRLPARPRTVISDSWHRVQGAGVDPDVGGRDPALDVDALVARRQSSGLSAILPDLTRGLDAVIDGGDNILVVADAHGRVLWRNGSSRVLMRADRLGFVEGADWAENNAGTNAIGTALASGRPVQVFSAEHFVRSHHTWTCTGSPIRDPRTGETLGVVDVSGPAATIHPTTLALVDPVARLAESQLREQHHRSLDTLRAVAAPILARSPGPALAVDPHGWVAALDTVSPRAQLVLPQVDTPGRYWVNTLGECDIEALPGGWLVRVTESADVTRTTVAMTSLPNGASTVTVDGGTGTWTHRPSPRHAQILGYLAAHPEGASAAQLSTHLFGVPDRTVTVRAEMSRLRKHLGGLIVAGPYRFADTVDVRRR